MGGASRAAATHSSTARAPVSRVGDGISKIPLWCMHPRLPFLAAMEVIVHHGGIPEDYVAIRIEMPDEVEILPANVPDGWPDLVPESITAEQGTVWVNS